MAKGSFNFSDGRFVDTYADLNKTIAGIQQSGMEADKLQLLKEQHDLANKRTDAQLALQTAAGKREADKYQMGLDKQKAIADAANVQHNVLSGEDGQKRFEGYVNPLAAVSEYDQAVAELDAKGITGAARNVEIDNLRDFYSEEIAAKDAAIGGELEDLSKDYSVVNKASGYDGLKYNIADDTYKQRVYDNLASTGLFTTEEALKEATARDSMMRTPTAGSDNIKAMRKDLDNAEKSEQDILKNTMERKNMSGGSSKKGKDYSYKVSTKDIISDAAKDAGMLSISGLDLRKMFNDVSSDFKGKGIKFSDSQLAEAAYKASSGENDAWTKGDFDVKKPLLQSELAKIVERDGPSGSSSTYNNTLYSKYGPEYATNARAISSKYAEARKQLNAGVGGELKGTGLAELESKYGKFKVDTSKPNNLDTVSTSKPSNNSTTSKIVKEISSGDKSVEEVAKKTNDGVKAVAKSKEAKELGITDEVVKQYATEYARISNAPNSTPAEVRGALIEKYGAKWAGFLGDALGELLAVGGNAVVAYTNDDRKQSDQLDYFTSDDMLRGLPTTFDSLKGRWNRGIDKIFGPTTQDTKVSYNAPEVDFSALQSTIDKSFKKNPDMDKKEIFNASLKLNQMSPAQQQLVFTAVKDPSLSLTKRINMLKDAGLTTKEANEALGQVNNLR